MKILILTTVSISPLIAMFCFPEAAIAIIFGFMMYCVEHPLQFMAGASVMLALMIWHEIH